MKETTKKLTKDTCHKPDSNQLQVRQFTVTTNLLRKSMRFINEAWTFWGSILPNHNQKDATFLDLFISTAALHVSGGSSALHQEHI